MITYFSELPEPVRTAVEQFSICVQRATELRMDATRAEEEANKARHAMVQAFVAAYPPTEGGAR